MSLVRPGLLFLRKPKPPCTSHKETNGSERRSVRQLVSVHTRLEALVCCACADEGVTVFARGLRGNVHTGCRCELVQGASGSPVGTLNSSFARSVLEDKWICGSYLHYVWEGFFKVRTIQIFNNCNAVSMLMIFFLREGRKDCWNGEYSRSANTCRIGAEAKGKYCLVVIGTRNSYKTGS